MKTNQNPYKQVLFVCTNARKQGERISCAGEGRCGEKLLEALKEFVKKNSLQKKVRVSKSGCHDVCEMGPNIAVMPQNVFISDLKESDIPVILDSYLTSLK
ncbi:MAG: (2Fe-2S) ferredoxin domain-containing protein [Elusimicrobiota bacterium]